MAIQMERFNTSSSHLIEFFIIPFDSPIPSDSIQFTVNRKSFPITKHRITTSISDVRLQEIKTPIYNIYSVFFIFFFHFHLLHKCITKNFILYNIEICTFFHYLYHTIFFKFFFLFNFFVFL